MGLSFHFHDFSARTKPGTSLNRNDPRTALPRDPKDSFGLCALAELATGTEALVHPKARLRSFGNPLDGSITHLPPKSLPIPLTWGWFLESAPPTTGPQCTSVRSE